jgi:galactose mutarotase-like enzyme
MVCCSLRHRGEELLGQRGGLERYVAQHSTMGIPLLHPWANRLSERHFQLEDEMVDVDVARELVATDPNGLPIHGLLAGHPGWVIDAEDSGPERALLRASFDFATDPRLLAAFPFPHSLELDVTLAGATLEVSTTLRGTGDKPVPVSFGYHPYLTLPEIPRDDWEVELPVSRQVVVDERMIPTGSDEAAINVEPGPLGERTLDDGYTPIAPGSRFALSGGGRRIEVTFEQGYPVAVVYAPRDDDVVCFEPMTAVTNALVSGSGLQWAPAGGQYRARFSISVASL